MFTTFDETILRGTRVDMARYLIVDPLDDVTDVELARLRGHNELLRELRGDSFADIAELIAH